MSNEPVQIIEIAPSSAWITGSGEIVFRKVSSIIADQDWGFRFYSLRWGLVVIAGKLGFTNLPMLFRQVVGDGYGGELEAGVRRRRIG